MQAVERVLNQPNDKQQMILLSDLGTDTGKGPLPMLFVASQARVPTLTHTHASTIFTLTQTCTDHIPPLTHSHMRRPYSLSIYKCIISFSLFFES